jgi:hypothetical protein
VQLVRQQLVEVDDLRREADGVDRPGRRQEDLAAAAAYSVALSRASA